ncbi:MAG: hypothetical protein KU37_04190 [Sulfuricurvum sp. PC08-66]|nr:MAG: hypothetical protein KU37_04190 [Sulfuricurvum sp. PC08-66]
MKELSFDTNEPIVSKTDTKGRITYGNELFLRLAGYTETELLGAPHNIIRHPDMPRIVFKLLWDTVQAGREIYAYVINRAKNGDYYWVLANVTPSFDAKGNIVGYYSVRRRPTPHALSVIQPFYRELLAAEKRGGMEASAQLFEQTISQKGGRYDQFILSLQA